MKKIEYMAPEMEVVDMKYNQILCASDGGGSTSDPNNPEEAEEGDY